VRILIDGEEKKKANLLSGDDFEPALIPPKTIPDPEDKKPEDWDERVKIPDPDAKKPEDWDEDAPMEIEDLDAEKPEGWLDDEPEEVDDPEATKPDDWDDEEDGEWEAPKISNPKCDEAPGCGEWNRPMKSNPEYKGKWYAPMIDNPNYKGIWKPQEIPNPDFFELEKPDLEPITAIGIEIWTMQDGILFDNVLITRDEKVAEEYREKTWKGKFSIEKEKQTLEDGDDSLPGELTGYQKKIFDVLYRIANIPFLDAYKLKIIDLIEQGEKKPNLTMGILVAVLVVLLTIVYKLLFFGSKKQPVPKVELKSQPDQDASASENNKEGSDGAADGAAEKEKSGDENEIEGEDAAPRQRRARRET